ncbi:MAG: hypothetical protein ACRDHZ_17905 [Ktedonobacteraceae bacterium]
MYFFSVHKKKAFPLIVIAMVALIAASFATSFSSGTAHAASTANSSVMFQGIAGTVSRLSVSQGLPTPGTALGNTADSDGDDLANAAPLTAAEQTSAPSSNGVAVNMGNGAHIDGVQHNFLGLTDPNQAAANGGVGQAEVTPPDQGLCTGFDPGVRGQAVVFETINSALREMSVNGQALSGHPLLGNQDVGFSKFWEPNAFSDPRCFFLPDSQTFIFTVIGIVQSGPDQGQTDTDVAVFNRRGFAVYQIDSSFGGKFFGDQPHVGYDSNNLYITTDAFAAVGPGFFGADLFAVPLRQLETEITTLNEVFFPPVTLAGIPIRTLEPAISTTPTQTEFLMNSFPFTATARILSTNQLGFWTVQHGEDLIEGRAQNITLSGRVIQSETYGFPVGAVSTGTGAVTNGITSEAILNSGDSRLLQVQFIDGHLWSALGTSLTVGTDPVVRDGVAWFDVDAREGAMANQGYIASAGDYLMYPAILHNQAGNTVITFSMTSATLNPSAAFVVANGDRDNDVNSRDHESGTHFGNIQIVAQGAGPHLSFSDALAVGGRARWGDYSAAAFAPNGEDFWLATEDITPGVTDPFDNWATQVTAVDGD